MATEQDFQLPLLCHKAEDETCENSDPLIGPPPPYSIDDPATTTPPDSSEVERVKRFLSYCLAVDYDLLSHTPDKLRKDDWVHFVRLSKRTYDVYSAHHPRNELNTTAPLYDWSDKCCHDLEVDKYLLRPAHALGMASGLVVWMLRLFVTSIRYFRSRPMSSIATLVRHYDKALLSWKLCGERDLLIDAVLPPAEEQLKTLMKERNQWHCQRHFRYLICHKNYCERKPE